MYHGETGDCIMNAFHAIFISSPTTLRRMPPFQLIASNGWTLAYIRRYDDGVLFHYSDYVGECIHEPWYLIRRNDYASLLI